MFNEAHANGMIQDRNRLRASSGLPLLDVDQEIRRLRRSAENVKFASFADENHEQVKEQVLAQYAGWEPKGLSWLAVGVRVQKRLREVLDETRA